MRTTNSKFRGDNGQAAAGGLASSASSSAELASSSSSGLHHLPGQQLVEVAHVNATAQGSAHHLATSANGSSVNGSRKKPSLGAFHKSQHQQELQPNLPSPPTAGAARSTTPRASNHHGHGNSHDQHASSSDIFTRSANSLLLAESPPAKPVPGLGGDDFDGGGDIGGRSSSSGVSSGGGPHRQSAATTTTLGAPFAPAALVGKGSSSASGASIGSGIIGLGSSNTAPGGGGGGGGGVGGNDPDGDRRKPCTCKNSECLKQNCDCFALSLYCKSCNCKDCFNDGAHGVDRDEAIKATLDKNTHAI